MGFPSVIPERSFVGHQSANEIMRGIQLHRLELARIQCSTVVPIIGVYHVQVVAGPPKTIEVFTSSGTGQNWIDLLTWSDAAIRPTALNLIRSPGEYASARAERP